ncbi:MAG: 5-formyltetrahydrofolate cyclo-ligase, partial [Rickettsiaceae bacterium]|nr:5-formyltetrahydrofolate cyclo-ligase [Rickettsiaceae bacterium]
GLVIATEKKSLRQKYSNIKSDLQNSDVDFAIAQNVLSILQKISPKIIGAYIPMKGEPNISKFLEYQALPKVIDSKLEFAYESAKVENFPELFEISKSFSSLKEPRSNELVAPDVIIVPAIAFDIEGYRLGRGGGCFDNYIARNPSVKTIGVCFSDKLLLRLPREDHDCRMDFIVTENFILTL